MKRRNLLIRVVQGFGLVGGGLLAYPFLRSFMPTFKQNLDLDVDISELAEGQSKVVHWLGRNLTISRRSQETVAKLYAVRDELKDPVSKNSAQPDFAENVYRSIKPEYFVAYNNCTHLGCEVIQGGKGFKCPCHQSDFDAAGRVFHDAAAPTNLEIPNYSFIGDVKLRLAQKEV